MDEANKKRKQTYVSKACDNCRVKHVKCDGNTPCARCIKKGITCLHEMVANKRGPTAGRIRELEDDLLATQRELLEQKKKNEQLEQYIQQHTATLSIEESYRDSSTRNFHQHQQQNQLIAALPRTLGSGILSNLLAFYNDSTMPFSGIPIPEFDVNKYWNNELDSRTTLLLNSMLSTSALFSGHTDRSRDIYRAAKQQLRNHHDDIHPYVAGSYTLLALYGLISTKYDKADLYKVNSHHISKKLLTQYQKEERSENDASLMLVKGIYANSLFKMINEATSDTGFLGLLDQFRQFHDKTSYYSKEFNEFGLLIGKVRHLLQNPQNWQDCIILIDEAHLSIPNTNNHSLRQACVAMLFAFRALVYHVGGNRNLCIKFAQEGIRVPQGIHQPTIMSVFVMAMIGQTLLYENALEQLIQVVDLLQTHRHLPVSTKISRWLVDPQYRQSLGSDVYVIFKFGKTEAASTTQPHFDQFQFDLANNNDQSSNSVVRVIPSNNPIPCGMSKLIVPHDAVIVPSFSAASLRSDVDLLLNSIRKIGELNRQDSSSSLIEVNSSPSVTDISSSPSSISPVNQSPLDDRDFFDRVTSIPPNELEAILLDLEASPSLNTSYTEPSSNIVM